MTSRINSIVIDVTLPGVALAIVRTFCLIVTVVCALQLPAIANNIGVSSDGFIRPSSLRKGLLLVSMFAAIAVWSVLHDKSRIRGNLLGYFASWPLVLFLCLNYFISANWTLEHGSQDDKSVLLYLVATLGLLSASVCALLPIAIWALEGRPLKPLATGPLALVRSLPHHMRIQPLRDQSPRRFRPRVSDSLALVGVAALVSAPAIPLFSLGVFGISPVAVWAGLYLLYKSRMYGAVSAEQMLAEDRRRPVVFLRSFKRERQL